MTDVTKPFCVLIIDTELFVINYQFENSLDL